MRIVGLGIVTALVLVACKGATAPDPPPPAPLPPIPPLSASAPPAAPAAPVKTCMMVNVCSCNLGCAAIRVEPSLIREGTHAKVESGALAGQEVKIVRVTDSAGASVLALTDLDHDHACSLPAERTFVGYGCAAKNSGAVPANACANGCE